MATIYDIAKRLNTSPSTVSRATSGRGHVRAELRERVLQTAREMGYQPNHLARGLTRKESLTIGLTVPDIANPYFATLARAIEDVADKNGYSVLFCNTDGDPVKERKYVQLLCSKQTDGVVFVSARGAEENVLPLLDAGIPIVLADRRLSVDADSVYVDNNTGAYTLTCHILEQGHRRIGLVANPRYIASGVDKMNGCLRALSEYGMVLEDDCICPGEGLTQREGYLMTKDLLKLDRPPTAIMCWNDILAVGALEALKEESVRIPEQIALTGYDDSFFAAFTNPSLTTVAQPSYELGCATCELLIERIRDKSRAFRHVMLSPKLVVRESSVRGRKTKGPARRRVSAGSTTSKGAPAYPKPAAK